MTSDSLLDVVNATLLEHHYDDHEMDEDDDPTMAKVIAMVVLFSSSQLLGLLPYPLAKWFNLTSSKHSNVLSTLLSFGAGVLICTTFLHLLPEVSENISHLQQKKLIADFPFHLGELLMCLGFFFVALVDQVVHWLLHHYQDLQSNPSEMIAAAVTRRSRRGIGSVADLIENDMENQKREHDEEHERQVATHQNGTTLSISNNRIVVAEPSCTPELPYHHHVLPVTASFSGLLMVLALSVHELFEGLAVGLENSSSNVYIMFISVFFHKAVISFCVGVERLVAKSSFCSMFFYVFSFAFASPLGIFLGIIISTSSSNQVASTEVLSVILQGIATGTLLYVIFFELLKKESMKVLQYAATLIGFFFMFALQFLTPHSHDHHHHEHADHDHHHT